MVDVRFGPTPPPSRKRLPPCPQPSPAPSPALGQRRVAGGPILLPLHRLGLPALADCAPAALGRNMVRHPSAAGLFRHFGRLPLRTGPGLPLVLVLTPRNHGACSSRGVGVFHVGVRISLVGKEPQALRGATVPRGPLSRGA